MSSTRQGLRSAILVSPSLWVPAAGGLLLVILAAAGVSALTVAFIGAGFGAVGGLICASFKWARRGVEPAVPPEVSNDAELSRLYRVLCEALFAVAGRADGNLKSALTQRLIALGVQFRATASGAGAILGTESWYVAHDAVLTVPDLKEYLAVVQVRIPESSQGSAPQESMRALFAAVRRGVLVERILVLPEILWPSDQLLPTDDVRPWIEDQHNHGLRVVLLRDRDLAAGPSFVDTCVFGDWAVGTRDLDDHSHTARVVLDFAPAVVRAALDRLEQLSRLGIPFGDLLDRAARGG